MPQEITVQELSQRLSNGGAIRLVDIREDWEREIGHLPGDLHIPMNTVPARVADFNPPSGGETVVYCHGGVRSMMVAGFLEQNGLPGVLSLMGGIDAWSTFIDPAIPRY